MPSIFEPQRSRKPDRYPWVKIPIKAIQGTIWTSEKWEFERDKLNFRVDLTPQERQMVVRSLSLIGQVEINVKRFWAELGNNLPHPSLSDLGYVFAYTEVVHNQAYERLLDVLGLEGQFDENLKNPIVSGRVEYLTKHTIKCYPETRKQYVYTIFLFTILIENISLVFQFYIICWMHKNRNVLHDTEQQVKYTQNEENLHYRAGVRIIKEIKKDHPELFDTELLQRIEDSAMKAIRYEFAVIDWVMEGMPDQVGLNAEVLKAFTSNRLKDAFKDLDLGVSCFSVRDDLLPQTRWYNVMEDAMRLGDSFHQHLTSYSQAFKNLTSADLFADKEIVSNG